MPSIGPKFQTELSKILKF